VRVRTFMFGKIGYIMLMFGRPWDGRVDAGQAPADDPRKPTTTPHPAGVRQTDRLVSSAGVGNIQSCQHTVQAVAQGLSRSHGRERGQQQKDAEVRVGPSHQACRPHRLKDRLAHGQTGRALQHRRDGGGAQEEVEVTCILEVAIAIDVAGLARGPLPAARQLHAQADSKQESTTAWDTAPPGSGPSRLPRPRR
jgi:hypothetical protein